MTAADGRADDHDVLTALAEEATRLIAAAQEWFHRSVVDAETSPIATGAAECAACPLCQLIRLLREGASSSASPAQVVADGVQSAQVVIGKVFAGLADLLAPPNRSQE
jgi:hypothetical protein